jgi:hypothetical protein
MLALDPGTRRSWLTPQPCLAPGAVQPQREHARLRVQADDPLPRNREARASSSLRVAPVRPAPRATRTSSRAKVDACAVSPPGLANRSNTRATTASLGPWSRSRTRPVTCRTSAPGRCRARPPPSATGRTGSRGLVLLGLAGGVDGPLHQPRRPRPPRGFQALHLGVDLLGPLRERPDQLLGHPSDLAVAVPVRLGPRHPQRAGQLPLQRRPVDRVRGATVPVRVAAVHGRPASVRALDAVGDHQVGVDQGSPAREVRWSKPTASRPLPTTCSAPPWQPGAELPVQVRGRHPRAANRADTTVATYLIAARQVGGSSLN